MYSIVDIVDRIERKIRYNLPPAEVGIIRLPSLPIDERLASWHLGREDQLRYHSSREGVMDACPTSRSKLHDVN
jgi:hypothetical protein